MARGRGEGRGGGGEGRGIEWERGGGVTLERGKLGWKGE